MGKPKQDQKMVRSRVESVQFAGSELECVYDEDDEIYVSLKRACEGLGITYSPQRRKLQDTHWATVIMMTTVAEDGRMRRLSVVDLDTLAMWLATISPSRVSEEARPKVVRYQKECVKALRSYFFERRPAENDDEPPRPPLEEREVRHPDGRVVIERYQVGHVTHRVVDYDPSVESDSYEPQPVEPDVPVELLRTRFHRALTAGISGMDEYQRLAKKYRGAFHQKVNRQLKAFVGRERCDWTKLDYSNAVHWLQLHYGLDIRWVLHPQAGGQ